jgi:hypothetical protein
MDTLLRTARWIPPLAVPVGILVLLIAAGVDLDTPLPFLVYGKTWRVGNLLDQVTLLAAMFEIALSIQISTRGQIHAVISMIVPRVILLIAGVLITGWIPYPNATLVIIASVVAPGLSSILRVSVARRDISIGL